MQNNKLAAVARAATLTILLFAGAGVAGAQNVVVGTIGDGQGKRCFICAQLLVDEIRALTRGEFDVRFPESKRIIGDWTRSSVSAGLDRLLNDPEVDVILAIGPLAGTEAASRGPLRKPVIAPLVIDTDLQGMPSQKDTSGVPNFTYVSPIKNFERDIEAFLRIVTFERLAILVDRGLLEALPQLQELARRTAAAYGFTPVVVPVDDNVLELLARFPDDVDAVFITPLARFSDNELVALANALKARGLPSFSFWGRPEVELGVLASMAADDDGQRLARRVALNVQRILLGEEPAEIRVSISQRERMTLNMDTVRAIGVSPPWDVLTEALLLNQAIDDEPRLTLRRAINIALQTNLALAVNRFGVELARDDLALARSQRRPQLEVGAQALVIDDDRAEASFGQQAERSAVASATVNQLIYADGVNADIDIRRHLLEAAANDLSAAELDTVLQTSTAFLTVLGARRLENIQIDNLETTRANLDLARTREAIGVSGPTEVIRWEREIADNLKSLAEARSTRLRAELQLNRALHRALDREFALADISVANAGLLATDPRVVQRVDNPLDLQVFTRFMVAEGLAASVEIRSLDASIAAQRRAVVAARRTRWPTVSAQAGVTNAVDESGEGSDVPSVADDTEWSVALNLSLPLYEGGGIDAELAQRQRELMQLQARRAELAEQIEARVVDAMFALNATYPSLEYTAQAADAARRNLESVSDAYSKGVASILDLLDAQNAALASNEAAARAQYALLGDFFVLQRAVGRFDYFLSDAERAAWLERLAAAFADTGR